jgi:3-oxoacyl-ACP reductase-like protein
MAAAKSEAVAREARPEVAGESSKAEEARAAAANARAAATRAAEVRAAGAAARSTLDDARVGQLYGTLVAERRRLQQPGKVSVDALASSLRETEKKLRTQYADKNIDFHVVVKDGKAMVKPIIG